MAGRLYDQKRWRRASRDFLQRNPLCRMCTEVGHTKLAVLVDHIIPHKGDPELFWDQAGNWQSLCATCHSGPKAVLERTGRLKGCDINGVPLDPGHHWNTEA